MNQVRTEAQLVSIVIITYNSGRYVLETLQSVESQTYAHLELIISDDCSGDDTIEICRKWLGENAGRFARTVLVESAANRGTVQNCNQGLSHAKGEWVKFIAGDDALEPHIISEYMGYINTHPDVAVVTSNMQPYQNSFEPENMQPVEPNESVRFDSPDCSAQEQFEILLRKNCVNAPTVMFKTEVLRSLGGFDPSFRLLEDWPMWLTLTRAGYKMHFVDTIGIKYRVHSGSIQQLHNKRIYKSKVESEVDAMYLQQYLKFLPSIEKRARQIIIYKDIALIRLFRNRRNKWVSFLSKALGFFPSLLVRNYTRKFL